MNVLNPSELVEMKSIPKKGIEEVKKNKKELFSIYDLGYLMEEGSSPYFGINLLGNLSVLPLELIELILSFLNYKEMCTISRLNWWFCIRSESDSLWKGLYNKTFKCITPISSKNARMVGWKEEFIDTLAWEDEWNPEKRSRQLQVTVGRRQITIDRGYEWSTCQIGRRNVNEYEKRSWTFRVLGSVGLMIGLVEEGWDFVDSYPGTGYYGCTLRNPSLSSDLEVRKPNQSLFSLAYYEVFDRFDKIVMEVDNLSKIAKFYRNDNLTGSIAFDTAGDRPLVPICALCGPSSSIEIIPSMKLARQRNLAELNDCVLPALSQSQAIEKDPNFFNSLEEQNLTPSILPEQSV